MSSKWLSEPGNEDLIVRFLRASFKGEQLAFLEPIRRYSTFSGWYWCRLAVRS